MKHVTSDKIRNIAVLAHGGAGKTSLCEAMLFNNGAADRLGKVEDGTTVTDYDPEETRRKISINTALASFMCGDVKFNLLDAPGYFDFEGEVLSAVRVADAGLLVVDGKAGVSVGTENAWGYCAENKIPRIFFVTKLDDDRSESGAVTDGIMSAFGSTVVPLQVPILSGEAVIGVADVMTKKAYKFDKNKLTPTDMPSDVADQVEEYYTKVIELIAETDDELMERFFEDGGESFTDAEITAGLRKGISECLVAPILYGSGLANTGVTALCDFLAKYAPSPLDRPAVKAADGKEVKVTDADPVLFVFKTVADQFVGKTSYFRVYSGNIKNDVTLTNARSGENERIAHMYFVCGKKQVETTTMAAGDIGIITKLADTKTNDTLCKHGGSVELAPIIFPKPNLSLAIFPKAKGDEEKISSGLAKLREEDATFTVHINAETHQQIVSGLGEQHLDVLMSKLKTKFGVGVEMREPRVPYRETIRKQVRVEGRHKKQSGGHGQFGHVWIVFEPGEAEGLTFAEDVFGGSVPRNYFPAVEKGLQESILHGVLAGYPVVNLKATLVDGSFHPVDSSEMAFKIAANLAYKAGMEKASPVLLEPIGKLTVTIPDSYMGDIMGDINKRRGRVLGMNPIDNMQQVEAEVPMSTMHKYATDLRSMTHGRGKFQFEFVRYEQAPENVAQKVIEESKKEEK